MIRIKDYILNENEIVYINEYDAESLGIMLKGKDKCILVDAHIEDIEWNYEQEQIVNCEVYQEHINIQIQRIKELEEENKRLKAEVDLLNDNKHYLNNKIDKAVKNTKELYKMVKEQDSDNVNLIDRLEIISKTLKQEEL